jgi:cell division septation protein DedD
MTEPLQFSLSRRSLMLVAVSLVTSVLLFFSAGMVGALLLHQKPQSPAPTFFTARKPNLMPSPSPARHPAAKPEARPRTPQLTLQVAAFEDQLKAQSFADSLQRQGFPVLSLGTMQLADKNWRTVRVGPYSDWDTASNVAADLQRSYNLDVYVLLH